MRFGRCLTVALVLCAALLPAACSGGGASTPTDQPPTETPFPTFAYVEPTKAPVFDQTSTATVTPDAASAIEIAALDPKKVERGRGRYEALGCGECHGAAGEGAEEGGSLLGFALSEDEFITFVRSGGDLGPRHQFSTDRLSNSGSRNLYEYLVSLSRSD